MLTFEINYDKNAVEVYGDQEGLKLLIKRLSSLIRKDNGSYIAFEPDGRGAHHRRNVLADHYTIFMTGLKPAEIYGPPAPARVKVPDADI